MSLAQVFSSFSSLNYSSSSAVLSERSHSADHTSVPDEGAVSDVYIASESYRFEASYSVYSGPSSTDASSGASENKTAAANNILTFIGTRLGLDKAEGATEEELASRLSAGLEGFIKGYQEAYEQLSALTFLNGDVENAIEQTYSDVLDGIDALSEEFGISSPVTSEIEDAQEARRAEFENAPTEDVVDTVPGGAQIQPGVETETIASVINNAGAINEKADNLRSLINASSYNYQASESRSFSFSLTTQDGDEVTIRAAYDTVSLLNGESVSYEGSTNSEVSGRFQASSGFYLDIQGELDEDELGAIEELLGQVKQVSDLFFSGDLDAAFDYALELGFDESEIADFSLRLRYEAVVKVEEAYQQVSPAAVDEPKLDAKDQRLLLVAQFVQALEDLRLNAKELGISGFSVVDAIDGLPKVDESERKSPVGIVSNLLSSLEQLQSQ